MSRSAPAAPTHPPRAAAARGAALTSEQTLFTCLAPDKQVQRPADQALLGRLPFPRAPGPEPVLPALVLDQQPSPEPVLVPAWVLQVARREMCEGRRGAEGAAASLTWPSGAVLWSSASSSSWGGVSSDRCSCPVRMLGPASLVPSRGLVGGSSCGKPLVDLTACSPMATQVHRDETGDQTRVQRFQHDNAEYAHEQSGSKRHEGDITRRRSTETDSTLWGLHSHLV